LHGRQDKGISHQEKSAAHQEKSAAREKAPFKESGEGVTPAFPPFQAKTAEEPAAWIMVFTIHQAAGSSVLVLLEKPA